MKFHLISFIVEKNSRKYAPQNVFIIKVAWICEFKVEWGEWFVEKPKEVKERCGSKKVTVKQKKNDKYTNHAPCKSVH